MSVLFSAAAQHHVLEQDQRTTKLDLRSPQYYYKYILQTKWLVKKY